MARAKLFTCSKNAWERRTVTAEIIVYPATFCSVNKLNVHCTICGDLASVNLKRTSFSRKTQKSILSH